MIKTSFLRGALLASFALGGLASSEAKAVTLVVTNGNDSGPGSLRQAVIDANASAEGDIIRFAPAGANVVLSSSLPAFVGPIRVNGVMPNTPNQPATVRREADSTAAFPFFTIPSGGLAELLDLNLIGGANNDPSYEGGIVRNNGQLLINGCELSLAHALNGGAVLNETSGNLTVVDSFFHDNNAMFGNGGAISNQGRLIVRSSSFIGNVAGRGGAIYTSTDGAGTHGLVDLDNSTFYRNSGYEGSAGIHVANGWLNVDSCTFSVNRAPAGVGGAIVADATDHSFVEVNNSILVGNERLQSPGTPSSSVEVSRNNGNMVEFRSAGHNLVGRVHWTFSPFTNVGDKTGVVLEDLGLQGPDRNGGRTPTMALAGNSRAIDTGDTPIGIDQRGVLRPVGDADDVGAFEAAYGPNTAPTVESTSIQGRVGRELRLRLNAVDAQNDILTFTLVEGTLPEGIQFDGKKGEFYGSPQKIMNPVIVKVQASDGKLASEPAAVTFHIIESGGLVVNSTGPDLEYDGVTTLREAIEFANASNLQSDITFDLPANNRTITLDRALPTITTDMSIVGPSSGGGITVQRSLAPDTARFSVFKLNSHTLRLANLTLMNGDNPFGGAIENGLGKLTLENCTVANNSADHGGGIFLLWSPSGGEVTLINCTLTGNVSRLSDEAIGGGGALSVRGGKVTIDSCTITGNSGVKGGAFEFSTFDSATFTIRNSIVAGNTNSDAEGGDLYSYLRSSSSPVTSEGHNLIGNIGNVNVFNAAGDKTGVAIADLKLGTLSDNGGPTPTFALLPGSAAVDAGETSLTTDQRGAPRTAGSADDIGAFEVRADLAVSIQSVTLSPEAPLPGQSIKAEVVATSSDGKTPALSYVWAQVRNGKSTKLAATGDTLDTTGLDLRRGDTVSVTVVAKREASESAPFTALVAIANTPIAIGELRLQPRAPYVSENMIATVKIADTDKPRPTYSYVWKRNGTVTRTLTDSRNSQDFYNLRQKGLGVKGDVIEVSVTASDGESTATASASATIRNSVPVVESLTLAPEAPTPTSTLISTYAGRDADGDKLTKTYRWRVGTKLLKDESGSRLDLRKYAFVKAGDVVSVDLQLFDGEAYSKTLTAKVTVAAPGLGTSAAAS